MYNSNTFVNQDKNISDKNTFSEPNSEHLGELGNGNLLPNKLLVNKQISNNAKLTYAFLYRQAGQKGDYHPNLERLAHDVGVHVSTVQGYLRELEFAGFIDVRLHVWRTTLKI
jgi:hypothetical protein